MYQFAIYDDLDSRPDLYPWLINVYVDKDYRQIGVGKQLLRSVEGIARKANLENLYLYTTHIGLYEKYGWRYIGGWILS